MSPIIRLLRRIPILRKAALTHAQELRRKRKEDDWAYVQSVLGTVGMMTIHWAGIERLLDELIAAYQHSHTDFSREHPRSLSNKLDYLKMLQQDERFPEIDNATSRDRRSKNMTI